MKKELALTGLLCLALSGCAGGNTPQTAPTVTETMTVTETATATVTAMVTAEPAAPVAAAAAPAVPAPPKRGVIPAAVQGMNAQALDEDLAALGFENVIYNADSGKTVLLLSNWTVTGIDNPGAKQPLSKAVVVHVTK
ncbi:hypothetical protein [Arthrobacter sp. ok909]|uniref:hypothetical protein n=1 Tax=Arthrobacter sp. ok909 TaxID=1761746 RepID=UPI001113C11C|nr:hypothetical protein [Arthrobacter sp. ok909]